MLGSLRRTRGTSGTRSAAVVLTCLLALTSCGGDSQDQADEETTSSPTATSSPSPTESEETEPPTPKPPKRPKAANTVASRQAFTRFVVDSWGYALKTNRATAVTELSGRTPCKGCPELRAELGKRKKQGWYVDFPGAKVLKVTVAPGEAPQTWVAKARVNIPASRSYFDDGAFRNENEAHKGATFEVGMRLVGKRYVLLSYRIV